MNSASPELVSQIQQAEEFAKSSLGTMTNIPILTSHLGFSTPNGFTEYLNGNVLDVGSGLNGLAIDVLLSRLPVKVTSINPAICSPDFEERQKYLLSVSGYRLFPRSTETEIESARVEANLNTLPLFAHDLSQFADRSFEVVIDNYAATYYSYPRTRLVFIKSMQEMARVCRGRIRVGDKSVSYGGKTPNWKELVLQDLGLTYTPHRYGFEIVCE